MFPRLLLFSTEEWLQDNVVTGDKGRLGSTDMCLCLQGETKMLITLFAKLKAANQFYERFTGLLLYTII